MKKNSEYQTDKPIKRSDSLKPLSREHHHGLLFCWKIRTGIKKKVEVSRIKKYADWFYQNYLIPHFEVEEKYVFPILGNENELIKRAVSEHGSLKRLLESTNTEFQNNISLISDELVDHIRFEERVLFGEIQKIATAEQLLSIEFNHSDEKFVDNLTDPFWQ
ncbi:hemerythrin domain-containing protein [Flavobacterium limnophilum]|uniref:hemerythrin domain-containing protein n=1 Tax=Flavobacterium limnophilum TaxID=3003262 RepID=UPI0024823321|nr:hemerythrin domain-containing protein [Flavobacterium limnophilum]